MNPRLSRASAREDADIRNLHRQPRGRILGRRLRLRRREAARQHDRVQLLHVEKHPDEIRASHANISQTREHCCPLLPPRESVSVRENVDEDFLAAAEAAAGGGVSSEMQGMVARWL